MNSRQQMSQFSFTSAIFNLLDPIPFGFFVAGLVFDIVYARTAVEMWVKGAAWLVTLGLLFAIVPQLINLARVWFVRGRIRSRPRMINFWLNVVGVVAALFNAFVHSRDAYGVVPAAVWLSILTVLAMGLGRIILASDSATYTESSHEQA